MQHAAFADLSNLQLVLTRFVYEDRSALPLSWRRALGFRRLLAAARATPSAPTPRLRPQARGPAGPQVPWAAHERRAQGSRGAALRPRDGGETQPSVVSATPGRRPRPRTGILTEALVTAVRRGHALCTFDLSHVGLGRVQVFVRRRGERVDCAVLCSREARLLVTRAVSDARAQLAREGMRLVVPPGGEAS